MIFPPFFIWQPSLTSLILLEASPDSPDWAQYCSAPCAPSSVLLFFRLRWVFVAVCGLSLVAANWGYSLLQCAGFLLQWLLLLWSMGSGRLGFSSCSTWAQ